MVTAGRAWAVLVAGVAVYEVLSPPAHLLTDGVRRAQERPVCRVLVDGAVIVTAAHLLGVLPARLDPFTRVTTLLKEHR